jgi:phosphotransferase system enzyme I (PtsP)
VAVRTLRAIASHLAITLENAAALYELHDHRTPVEPAGRLDAFTSGLIHGQSASRGLAIGHVVTLADRNTGEGATDGDLADAIDRSIAQLQELQRRVDKSHSDVAALIFSSHLLMLQDESFVGEIVRLHASGTPAGEAVDQVVEEFCRRFQAIPDPRFQEKAQDVRDIGHRIERNLASDAPDEEGDYRGAVVILNELFPSELVKLYLQRVEGIVFSGGAATGHVAILARSLGVPLVAAADPALLRIPSHTRVVVDAEDGKIVVDPIDEVLAAYRRRIKGLDRRRSRTREQTLPPVTATVDGTPVTLLANVNLVKDAREARRVGAAGIGLYRSEFPFLIRNGFPTEDEQYAVYARIIEAIDGRPVAFRTLDLGGDKLLSSQVGSEENPFLGFRGIRFLLEHRDILRDQLRAMIRAGAGHEIAIQFPMISGPEEFLDARAEVASAIESLRQEGVPYNESPRLGVMIELPSAVELAPEIARHAEFLSLGTNDLIMYTLAADRGNHRVASLYRRVHPAILRVIARLTSSVPDADLSVCGAAAADPAITVFLLGLGVRKLSVNPDELVTVSRIVGRISIAECEEEARHMLGLATIDDLERHAESVRESILPDDDGEDAE